MTTQPTRIGVMICTAKRPNMVCRCIESVIAQDVPSDCFVEICVVENDQAPNSRNAIEALAKVDGRPVLYFQETRQGIPFARNKTLAIALERRHDWIALIDDDEVAEPTWLASLMEAAKTFNADAVNGPVERTFHAPVPEWWKSLKPVATVAGTELDSAPTNNTFFRKALIDPSEGNLRFEESLTFGFEDIDFFSRAHHAGYKIVWAPKAVVSEEIPASRLQPERLLQRVRTSAAAHAYATRLRKGSLSAWWKFGPKALRRILAGSVLVLLALPARNTGSRKGVNRYYKARVRLARGIGNLSGLLHLRPDYYGTVDGN